jgi:hypothetical protein
MGKLHLFTHSTGGWVGPRAGLDALGFEARIVKTTAHIDYANPAPPTREKLFTKFVSLLGSRKNWVTSFVHIFYDTLKY